MIFELMDPSCLWFMIPLEVYVSRLEDLIHRFVSQREHLNRSFLLIQETPGVVVEVGLGSGRTFSHLRENLQDRKLFAFDFRVETHPGCEPSKEQAVLGNILETFPQFAKDFSSQMALIHLDIGTINRQADKERYQTLAPSLLEGLCSGGVIVSDRLLEIEGIEPLSPLPEDSDWSYFSYRKI